MLSQRFDSWFRPLSLAALAMLLIPLASYAAGPISTEGGFALINAPQNPATRSRTPEVTLMLQGQTGIQNAPISAQLRQDLLNDWAASGSTPTQMYFINPQAVTAIENSLATGQLDPYLLPYAEGQDQRGSCSDRVETKTKNFSLDWDGASIDGPVGSFTGDLALEANINGDASVVFQYRIKRFGIFGACIPYWVKFDHFRTFGDATLDGAINLTGSISNTSNPWKWSYDIAKPHLGSLNFWIGPVYVHLGFNLPITAGVQVGVSAATTVTYEAEGVSTGSFDYTCHNFQNCEGNSSFNLQNLGNPVAITGSIEGRADIRGYVDIGVRAYLYSEGFAYAQVGVRPQAFVDVWGYLGNNCGDVDCDQSPETLAALTTDVDWQLFVTAKADAFIGGPWTWDDIWHTPRRHLAFWNFFGSDVANPMLHGPESVPTGTPTTYQARMRPCWPYDDFVNYEVQWEDGSVNTFSNPPDEYQDLNHIFWQQGDATVTLTAISDSHGRQLNTTTSRDITVSPFGETSDSDCSAGGTDTTTGDGNGGGDPDANLICIARANTGNPGWDMECSGQADDGLAPYTYYWKYGNGNWFSGSASRTFTCLDFDDPISFKVRDANGTWSNVMSDACPGGIA